MDEPFVETSNECEGVTMIRLASVIWIGMFFGCMPLLTSNSSMEFTDPPKTLPQYAPFRLQFQLSTNASKLFEYETNSIYLEIETPSGRTIKQPAFYIDDYKIVVDRMSNDDVWEVARRIGSSHWEVRWTPDEIGNYRWKLLDRRQSSTAKPLIQQGSFECQPSSRNGFIRVSKSDPNYFETSDGEFFYPLGHGTRSPQDDRNETLRLSADGKPISSRLAPATRPGLPRTATYERWFQKMQAAGENHCFIWMAPWWGEIEWTANREGYNGLGYYNQKHAAELDRVFQLAEQYGIRIQLYTMNHGRLGTTVDEQWFDSPYCVKKEDDSFTKPADFFASDLAKKNEENRLRYILARWGYSTSLMGIVLCSEIEWIDPFSGLEIAPNGKLTDGIAENITTIAQQPKMVMDWFKERAAFVREHDIHNHLVAIQFASIQEGNRIGPIKEFDVTLNNAYQNQLIQSSVQQVLGHIPRGIVDGMCGWSKVVHQQGKPLLIAEWGGDHMANGFDTLETELRIGVWAASMTEMSGVTGFWWSQSIDKQNWYRFFSPVARFWKDYDRRNKKLESGEAKLFIKRGDFDSDHSTEDSLKNDVATFVEHPLRNGGVLTNDHECFGYLYHNLASSKTITLNGNFLFIGDDNVLLKMPERLKQGKYSIGFYDTSTGNLLLDRPIVNFEIDGSERSRYIQIPPFRIDIAFKVSAKETSSITSE